ncbi:MAG: Plug domain-containing protein, partial [Bacteroidales bacterium]
MKHFRFFLFVIFIFFLISGYAQEGMLKGFIYDHENGEAIGYCPVGKYVVQISLFGYDNFLDTVEIKQGVTVKRYFLYSSKVSLDAVQITAESQRKTQETRISVVSVTPKEMSKMPAIGGQPDFAQYLQVLPGIVSTGDQGGQLYVRGGTPTQNMLLLDGMIVYNPFHSIGLFSVFDSEIMSNADVYTGGYGAEFGGRISSVMDIQTRDGNKKRLSGKIDFTNIGAQLLLEGPFVKLKDN